MIAVGVIASAPLIAGRAEMEQSSNQVDFVFDYRDLIEISTYKADPQCVHQGTAAGDEGSRNNWLSRL